MAHSHIVVDGDMHFTIDPATREIENGSGKATIIQNDHNSERFTFELPKIIDGHDMTKCNAVQVHYLNVDNATRTQTKGIYEVDDLAVSKTDTEKVTFTWLLSRNATKYVGSLNFVIRFSCVAEDGTVTYAWHTAVFSGISVSTGIYNTETIVEDNIDILEQWKAEILAQAGTGGTTSKTFERWKDNTKYKEGDMCYTTIPYRGYSATIMMVCIQDHISSEDNAHIVNLHDYWRYWYFQASGSICDVTGNIIHETYATKSELQDIQEKSATKDELGGIHSTLFEIQETYATKAELTAAIGEALEGDY